MHQVDVSEKPVVKREAIAEGYIRLSRSTIELIKSGGIEKGDPLTIAKLGGIIGAKNVPLLLPLCHQLKLEHVDIDANVVEGEDAVRVVARVVAHEKTGVEMEALTAVTVALLNVWDVAKAYEKDELGQYPLTEIYGVRVLRKEKEMVV